MTEVTVHPSGGDQAGARQPLQDVPPGTLNPTDPRLRMPGAAPSAPGATIHHDDGGGGDNARSLRPRETVRRLDQYIVGQSDAKRAVAIALRNRFRRRQLPEALRDEVLPKNILMIGPTGVGKTEIARRLARLTDSPFIKVEATKFTEVGYVGRDVESIVRDLLEQTITELQAQRTDAVEQRARQAAEERILDALVAEEENLAIRRHSDTGPPAARAPVPATPHEVVPGAPGRGTGTAGDHGVSDEPGGEASDAVAMKRRRRLLRRRLRKRLDERRLEDHPIEIEVEESFQPSVEAFTGTGMEDVGLSLGEFFSHIAPPRRRSRRLPIAEARQILIQDETDRLIDVDRLYDDAIREVEDDGIVFIDEIDKICGRTVSEQGPDISGEGVQRDLLPIIEGSTVQTRYGPLCTDHVLFIGAGAFSATRPSDLIPEFQGRFPIRVELSALSVDDLERILTEPSNALTKQYVGLLGTENVTLQFTPEGVHELAEVAARVNAQDENIGARRLFTILERVLEDVSFRAEDFAGQTVVVDAAMVHERLDGLTGNEDLRRYVL